MSMFDLSWLRKRMQPVPLAVKDPMDWRLTASSTPWDTDEYCTQCKHTIRHREIMARMCNNCGYSGRELLYNHRAYRQIWDGSKWMWQYKYGNGADEFDLEKEPCHLDK